MVRRGLVDDDQLTGKCCLVVKIENTVLLAEKARIQVKTPYLSGEVEELCIPEVICDVVVGNFPGARNPDDPDMTAMVGAVTQGPKQDRRSGISHLQYRIHRSTQEWIRGAEDVRYMSEDGDKGTVQQSPMEHIRVVDVPF